MSTNAALVVYNVDDHPIVTVYKHWDGYPDGVLADVQKLFSNAISFSGLPPSKECEMFVHVNGMDDFAAQLVVALKKAPGDVYLYSGDADVNVQWTYIFTVKHHPEKGLTSWLWVDIIEGNADGTHVWSGFLNDWIGPNA